MRADALRHGDLVEVKSATEILATLDDCGALDTLPFMPEMVQYCGRRFRVDKTADKICDTIQLTGSRRLPNTVLLEDLRCDGSGHDGCQAECRLFWKEAWVRRVKDSQAAPRADRDADTRLTEVTTRSSAYTDNTQRQSVVRYRCQATELFRATYQLKVWDPRPYLKEYVNGNVGLRSFLRVLGRAVVLQSMRKAGLRPHIVLPGSGTTKGTAMAEPLQPGEFVTVRTKEEIAQTLKEGRNRGLWFDGDEMLPFCGGTYRVRRRITHFIDERNGEMLRMKSDCITLDGVVCSGERSLSRWFCPRAIYPYWREAWLRRVGEGTAAPVDIPQAIGGVDNHKHHSGAGHNVRDNRTRTDR
jgi:hypothetical protein